MRKSYAELRESVNHDSLIASLRTDFAQVQDHRAPNVVHSLVDILLSGFAIFSLKYSSLLSFEQQTEVEKANLCNLYGINKICSDAQMRRVLDEVNPEDLQNLFPQRINQLKQLGVFTDYRFLKKYLLVSVDGVHHFSSKKVKCKRCCVRNHRNGESTYHHSLLSAALVHPERKEVFTLGGEAIVKQDGKRKNDCEQNAAVRLQQHLHHNYSNLPFVFLEDALYATEPHIALIRDNEWDFIINVKPTSHEVLFRLFEGRRSREQVKSHLLTLDGVEHHFYWMNNVPLNGKGNQRVNFLYYEEHLPNGKVKCFSWVTSLRLRKSNLYQIMRGGRSRWKIENEGFNTLKNQGYHFSHNFGHGYNHLANNMAHLMLLAFLIDQVVQVCDRLFRAVWKKANSKTKLWERMRAVYFVIVINSFNELFIILAQMFKVKLE